MLLSLETKTRPKATVGWPDMMPPPGMPKAHFSFSFAASAAVSLAFPAGWKWVFVDVALHPSHDGDALILPRGGLVGQAFVIALTPKFTVPENGLPVTNFASARLSRSTIPLAWTAIRPVAIAS